MSSPPISFYVFKLGPKTSNVEEGITLAGLRRGVSPSSQDGRAKTFITYSRLKFEIFVSVQVQETEKVKRIEDGPCLFYASWRFVHIPALALFSPLRARFLQAGEIFIPSRLRGLRHGTWQAAGPDVLVMPLTTFSSHTIFHSVFFSSVAAASRARLTLIRIRFSSPLKPFVFLSFPSRRSRADLV